MKKINFKKPKYILPIICLPFIIGIGWIIKDFGGSQQIEQNKLIETSSFNHEIPEAELLNDVQNKFDALKVAFKKSIDYSAVQNIEEEEAVNEFGDGASLYSENDVQIIDSLNAISKMKTEEMELEQQNFDRENVLQSIEMIKNREKPQKEAMLDEMELFKMQMDYIDSIQNPKSKPTPKPQLIPTLKDSAILVEKAESLDASYFNSIHTSNDNNEITAIIDEPITVVSGSRVRIRLMDDLIIQNVRWHKGKYLYGNVSSFSAQRVKILITSLIINGKRIKVNMSVYDNDGQEGLYVPGSDFRELSKEVGAGIGSTDFNTNSDVQGIEQVAYGAIQDAYRSTARALSQSIKTNKAKLKYNTQISLINKEI